MEELSKPQNNENIATYRHVAVLVAGDHKSNSQQGKLFINTMSACMMSLTI